LDCQKQNKTLIWGEKKREGETKKELFLGWVGKNKKKWPGKVVLSC